MPKSNQRVMEQALRKVIEDEKTPTKYRLQAVELLAQVNGVDMRRKQRIRKKQAERSTCVHDPAGLLPGPCVQCVTGPTNERVEELKRLI